MHSLQKLWFMTIFKNWIHFYKFYKQKMNEINALSLSSHTIHLLSHTHTTIIHSWVPKYTCLDNYVMRKEALVNLKSLKFTLSLIQQKVKCATKSLHHHDLLYILNSFIKNGTWCVSINFLNKWAFFNGNKLYLLIKQICVPRHSNKYQTYWLILKFQIKSLCSGKTS